MTYYPDLTPYVYSSEFVRLHSYNVGWLDGAEQFARGDAPHLFLERLLEFCEVCFAKSRGWHTCNLCVGQEGWIKVPIGEKAIALGTAEIRVIGKSGKIYCAPNLIYHYVAHHKYVPPKEFIEAVMLGSKPSETEYSEYFAKLGLVPESPTLDYGQKPRYLFQT